MSDKERKRQYYRNRPEFREHILSRVKERHATNSADPDYRRLVALRKAIYQVRQSYEARVRYVARLDKRLVELATELAKAQKVWKAKKARGTR